MIGARITALGSALFFALTLAACGSLGEDAFLQSAAKPLTETLPIADDFSFDCGGFTVLGYAEGSLKIIIFFDQQGNFVRDQLHFNLTGTYTHALTGSVVAFSAHYTDALDGANATLTFTGVPLKLKLPDGTVIADAGKLVFDLETGEVLVVAGPHALLGNVVTTVCDALR
jgi:hypothetical protein